MKTIVGFTALSLALVGCGQAASPPQMAIDKEPITRGANVVNSYAAVVSKVAPSVVTVYSKRTVKEDLSQMPFLQDPLFRRFFGVPDENLPGQSRPMERMERGLGSGVVVSPDGYILSNNHVVENADEVKVALPNSSGELIAKVIGTDPQTDIAVLKVPAKDLSPITLTESENLQVGDVVLAVGNPFGVGQTVTMGIVSAVGRGGMGITAYEDFIQTDASINPGNSGGALVDAKGRLIGINTAILSRTGGNVGVGFAVPVTLARNVMDQIIKTGKVRRGYLGVTIQPVTSALAKEFKLPNQTGALVSGVSPDSPAGKADIQNGDVITEFNGQEVKDSRHLQLMVSQAVPGTKATLKLIRDGKEQTAKLTLGELPANAGLAGMRGQRGGPTKSEVLEGVQISDVTGQMRQQLNIPSEINGALVTNVDRGSAAADAGLRSGDVILEVNRHKVRNAQEAIEWSNKGEDKRTLLRVWSQTGTHYVVVESERGQ